jgi:hypothetical protein
MSNSEGMEKRAVVNTEQEKVAAKKAQGDLEKAAAAKKAGTSKPVKEVK